MTDVLPDSPRDRTLLLVLLGVLGGVIVLAVLWLLVIGPLFTADEEPIVVRTPEPAEPAEPTPEAEPTPVPETFEVFTARDPFQQLAEPEPAAGPAPAPTPAPGVTPTPTPTPTPDPADPPPEAEVGVTRIRLVDVFTDEGVEKVLVTVNGRGYEVAEGEVFADRFRVLDISPPCATFLFGDSRFVLCVGEEIRK